MKFRSSHYSLFAICLMVVAIFAFSACDSSSDNCEGVDCGLNGTCDEDSGACICDAGFFGANCEQYDSCYLVECPENASCNPSNGTCECDEGFYSADGGISCIGLINGCILTEGGESTSWNVTETCTGDPDTYTYQVVMKAGSSSDKVLIENFGDFGVAVVGDVSFNGTNIIEIIVESQTIGDLTLSGNAALVAGSCDLANWSVTYTNTSISETLNCTPSMAKL